MNRHLVVPAIALGVIALAGSGCETHRTTAPTPPERPAAPPPVATPPSTVPYVDPGFPPAPAGAAVYGRITSLSIPSTQRYVLENGRFALQTLSPRWGFREDAGSYTRTETGAHLVFDAWSLPGPWEADVTFDGDLMAVRYNLIARFDDFEDGIFERQPAGR